MNILFICNNSWRFLWTWKEAEQKRIYIRLMQENAELERNITFILKKQEQTDMFGYQKFLI
ncbi:hypothetical protein CNEO2_410007 [Clostridium neonatale]|nr:hypothetical protein CNEO2_410007 [Clostridium neonatale]CAI4140733.1 hypothetical protein CNEO4_460067 [Clostridium neonatale]